jgi:hypothetical protein
MDSERPPAQERAADERAADQEYEEGGDPVCWAHLVCPECGSITTEGHAADCGLAEGARGAIDPESRR